MPPGPDSLDLDALRRAGASELVLAVASWRNQGASWREVCLALGCSRATARAAYADAVRRLHVAAEAQLSPGTASGGDEARLRGLPLLAPGVSGVARWSRPGDPGWLAAQAVTTLPRQHRRQGPQASR